MRQMRNLLGQSERDRRSIPVIARVMNKTMAAKSAPNQRHRGALHQRGEGGGGRQGQAPGVADGLSPRRRWKTLAIISKLNNLLSSCTTVSTEQDTKL